jgi:hypothetical protein
MDARELKNLKQLALVFAIGIAGYILIAGARIAIELSRPNDHGSTDGADLSRAMLTGMALKAALPLAHEKLSYHLRDPESARFRDEFLGNKAVCGEINTRNGFGGMVGFKRYLVTLDWSYVAIDDPEIPNFQVLWERACAKRL